MQQQVITLTPEEVKDHPYPKFYELIANKLGCDISLPGFMCDCREINIANNIQDYWFKYYKEKGCTTLEIAMSLLMSAPKVDVNLPDNNVEVFDGFIIEDTDNR